MKYPNDGELFDLDFLIYLFEIETPIVGLIWCEWCEIWAPLEAFYYTESIYCEVCGDHDGIVHETCNASIDPYRDKARIR